MSIRNRLMAFGLVPGAELSVYRVAPLGDPVCIMVNETRILLRRTEARCLALEIIE